VPVNPLNGSWRWARRTHRHSARSRDGVLTRGPNLCTPPPPSRRSEYALLYAIRARTAYGLRRAPSWRRYCNFPAALFSSTSAVAVPFRDRSYWTAADSDAGVVGVDMKMPKFRYLCPTDPERGLVTLLCEVDVFLVLFMFFFVCFVCFFGFVLSGDMRPIGDCHCVTFI